LRDAAAAHCKTIQGIEMLIEQGALAFTHWTGIPAPVDVMRQAAHRAADSHTTTQVTV
jgi:shikimate dehydrogenase